MKDTVDMYVDSVRKEFFHFRRQERQFIKDFEASVRDYTSCHPYTYNSLVSHFGTPQKVAKTYHSSFSPEQCLCAARTCKRTSVLLVLAVLICIVISFCVVSYILSMEEERQSKMTSTPNDSFVTSQITTYRSK